MIREPVVEGNTLYTRVCDELRRVWLRRFLHWINAVLFCAACGMLGVGCSPAPEQVEQSDEAKAILKKQLETLDSANDEAARQAAKAHR